MSSRSNKLTHSIDGADYRTFVAGDVIARCPTKGETLVGLITRGVVSCTYFDSKNPECSSTHYLQELDWIGIDALDCQCGTGASICWAAEEVCVIAFMTFEQARQHGLPDIVESMVESLVRQKRRAIEASMRLDMSGSKRLERGLRDLARSYGTETPDGCLLPKVNRTDLAASAKVGREYTSRHLRRLKEEGKIEMHGKSILIKSKTLGV
jgi:CRP-like cAMP-binding protein